MSLTPHPHHRTRVTRADNSYPLGQPPPALRIEAGEVVSVESDSCTVLMFGELVAGVVFLADPPAVGDAVEVWEADDLLWTPGYVDSSTGGTDAAHLVSRTRPAAVDMPVPIGGSFRDDSWFFEAIDQPDWADAAREDLSGVEVTRDGADTTAVLWSDNPFDVRPGDSLTFHLTASYLSGTVATAQLVICYGDDDSDPLPTSSTTVVAYGTAVAIDGTDDELDTTWVVPATVATGDDPALVPRRGRVGIRLVAIEPPTLTLVASSHVDGTGALSIPLPASTAVGDVVVFAVCARTTGAGVNVTDSRVAHVAAATPTGGASFAYALGYLIADAGLGNFTVTVPASYSGSARVELASFRTNGTPVAVDTAAVRSPGPGFYDLNVPSGCSLGIMAAVCEMDVVAGPGSGDASVPVHYIEVAPSVDSGANLYSSTTVGYDAVGCRSCRVNNAEALGWNAGLIVGLS